MHNKGTIRFIWVTEEPQTQKWRILTYISANSSKRTCSGRKQCFGSCCRSSTKFFAHCICWGWFGLLFSAVTFLNTSSRFTLLASLELDSVATSGWKRIKIEKESYLDLHLTLLMMKPIDDEAHWYKISDSTLSLIPWWPKNRCVNCHFEERTTSQHPFWKGNPISSFDEIFTLHTWWWIVATPEHISHLQTLIFVRQLWDASFLILSQLDTAVLFQQATWREINSTFTLHKSSGAGN